VTYRMPPGDTKRTYDYPGKNHIGNSADFLEFILWSSWQKGLAWNCPKPARDNSKMVPDEYQK